MYYLFKKYEKDFYVWCEGYLGIRVFEIFKVFYFCLILLKFYSFFIFGYNLLFLKGDEVVVFKVKEVIDIFSDLKNG